MGTTWITAIEGERWNLLMAGKELQLPCKVGKTKALLVLAYGNESGLLVELHELPME